MPEDLALLEAWQGGDADSGNELLKRYFSQLYRFFRNKTDDSVDDLIQKTMLALVRWRDGFRKECSFRSFLFTVARNELYRHYRSKGRDRLVFDPAQSSIHDLSPSPSTAAAKTAEQRLLLEAMRRIPLDLQVAIELFYWEDMSTQELADALEIPQGTVKSRLRRAREALHAQMEKIAESKSQLQSTVDNLEQWARSIRGELVAQAG